METNIFNLDYTRWEIILIALLPAAVNFSIFFYSYLKLQRNSTTTLFSLFVLVLGLLQISDGFVRMSTTANQAEIWNRIGGIIILLIIAIGIQFTLSLSDLIKNKFSRILSVVLYAPSILFFVFISGKMDRYNIVRSENLYWIINPEPTLVTLSIYIWVTLGAILILGLFWLHYFKSRKESLKGKQALALALGMTLPVISGVLFEILYPLLLEKDTIPITTPVLSLFSVTSLIAIKKYRMLDYSPRQQWDRIAESLNEGILITDNDGRIKYANKAFCTLLEYEFSEISGKMAYELFLTSDSDKNMVKNLLKERKKGVSSEYEMILNTKSGVEISLSIKASPFIDEQDQIAGSIEVMTNVTEHKKATQILKHNEKRLRQAQEVAHVGSWELNFATQKSIWSEEACKMYGFSPSERFDQTYESWFGFIHPDDVAAVSAEIERSRVYLSDSSMKHRIVWKDGTVKHIHSVSKFEFNSAGFPIGLFGVCHDITAQVEARKALEESETNMRTFINESLLSIYFVDPLTKRINYANPAFSELLGYSPEELKNLSPYDFINHSVDNIHEQMSDVMKNKRIKNGEREWRRKDGKIIKVLINCFYHKNNGYDMIYVTAQDVTEIKNVEQKLKLTNQELEMFIYKISHDLRGPLASIIGLSNVSKLEIKDQTALKYLQMIGEATGKLDYVLKELIKAIRIKGTQSLNDEINFESMITDALLKFEHAEGYSGLKVNTRVSYSKPFISNRFILDTIFQNLIENGIKYQKRNCPSPFLGINVEEADGAALITIEDNGIGIDKTVIDKIFELYFRGTEESKGSGLGLYLVKKGVEKLKGTIGVHSVPGNGTRFTILLNAA